MIKVSLSSSISSSTHPVTDLGQSCIRTKEVGRSDPRVLAVHSLSFSIPCRAGEHYERKRRTSDIQKEELIEIIMQRGGLALSLYFSLRGGTA